MSNIAYISTHLLNFNREIGKFIDKKKTGNRIDYNKGDLIKNKKNNENNNDNSKRYLDILEI